MAENNLLQSNPGNATTRDWDENERRQGGHSTGNYENTGYGSEIGQQRSNYANQQQDYVRDYGRSQQGQQHGQQGQGGYAQGSSGGHAQGAGNYGQGSYGQTSYGQQNWNPSQDYNRGYGQSGQQQGQGFGNQWGQQDYNRSGQQNWGSASQDYGRGSYGHYGNMGSSYGGNYGEGRSSYQGGMGSQDWGRSGYGTTSENYGPYNQSSWRPQESYTPAGYQDTQDWGRQGAQGQNWGNERQNQSHRGRGPRGYNRSDERITEDVNDRLSDDPVIDASDIEVKVNNGEITLEGSVDSREAKRRAEDIAESISGVQNVENRIRVKKEQGREELSSSSSRGNTERTGTSTSSTERSSSKSGRS